MLEDSTSQIRKAGQPFEFNLAALLERNTRQREFVDGNSRRATWKLYQPENLMGLIHLSIRKSSNIVALIFNGSSFSLCSCDFTNSSWDIWHIFIKLLKVLQHVFALVDIISWRLSNSFLLQLIWRRRHGATLVTNHQHTQRFHSSSVSAKESSWWWGDLCCSAVHGSASHVVLRANEAQSY